MYKLGCCFKQASLPCKQNLLLELRELLDTQPDSQNIRIAFLIMMPKINISHTRYRKRKLMIRKQIGGQRAFCSTKRDMLAASYLGLLGRSGIKPWRPSQA